MDIQDSEIFFKYLEEEVLREISRLSIIEYAFNVEESQSRWLVKKYKEIRQFLVAKSFDCDNPFNVKGVGGLMYVKNYGLKINHTSFFPCNERDLPNMCNFDVLLIRGMISDLFSLYGTKLRKVFGDVIDKSDTNYKSLYEAIFKLIKDSSSNQYELCHEELSSLGKEIYLIKRK